ncbi:aldehyde dehydrogenase family protein [Sphingomonas immobilis]|uniref:Aldehyde dehydrogenase family protein n=1 Tax=Sphingomonas immobilis TaxID=3063997 RepID=A0ABT9A0X2_9SPHN|nr:aldehyde dehydrogenase family protein [Sphingomonas sp. CA1-15]MDO7843183.1 aldehyde dehydrogenase family protein [Sphingomonas sp. CA1-15]
MTLQTDKLWIAGQPQTGLGPRLEVENPATGAVFATLNEASVEQVDAAVRAAQAAFASGVWDDPEYRADTLLRLADLIEQHRDALGALLVDEVGTPVDLVGPLQVGTPISFFRYYAGLARIDRSIALGPDGNAAAPSESVVRFLPVGVAAAITAYNYPLLLLALKVAPAFAAGCAVVILCSPQTPLATLALGALMKEAGVPDGIVSVLVGGAEIGKALSEHPGIDKISFTGSVGVGSRVMQQAGRGLKRVTLELGGKNAMILLPDYDFEPTIAACHIRYLRNAGQGCASPTRILVHRPKMAAFIAATQRYFATVKTGDPRTPGTLVGPLISEAHRARVEGVLTRALLAGAKIVAGGGRPDLPQGWYLNPTLVAGADNHSELARDELFAPVAMVIPYDDIDEAVAMANDSDLGLSGFVFGPHEAAMAVAKRIRTGTVYVNGGGAIRMEAPMGGFKQSGIGREYGEYGIREYLEPQHIQWSTA